MWLLRELLRLLEKIFVAVLIAIVLAEVRTLISGGDRMHTFQISLVIVGALLLMMGAAGNDSAYDRHLSAVGHYWAQRSGVDDAEAQVGPVLTAGAVFVISGAVVIAVGLLV
jgi:uncharacterized membrane protein